MEWYLKVIRDNYFNFEGRARRKEYWYYILFNILIIIFLGLLCSIVDEFVYLLTVYIIAIIIPTLGVIVRRLHDSGKSGWYFFVRLIPVVGSIWLLVLLCTDSEHGINRYGKNPKMTYDEFDEIGKKDVF